MHYFSISFTHKNTSIDVRERLAINDNHKKNEFIRLVIAHEQINECVVLSTCNRLEVMCYANELVGISEYIIKCLCLVCKIDEVLIKNSPDIYEDSGFIHHLFSVASSLDSLVIGETQIVGQLKDALNFSLDNDYFCDNLSIAINYAFKCAATIRNETQISKNSVSVSSVAVAKARELLDLKVKKVLLIGSGLMIELACKHLLNHTNNLCVISRTLDNAKALANRLNIDYDDYANLDELINSYDVIFSATSSENPIITKELIKKTNHRRYFFDIAVPRDIELSNSDDICVFSVDDLNEIVKKNIEFKDEQAKLAYSVVSRMLSNFYKDLNQIQTTPIIKAMRFSANDIIEKELQKALKKGYLKNSDEIEVKKFAKQLLQAYLHEPTIRLKKIDEYGLELDTLNYLFDVRG